MPRSADAHLPNIAVILPAAGLSLRFGSNKLSQVLAGRPVLQHSVLAFLQREDVAQVILATSDIEAAQSVLSAPPSSDAMLHDEKLLICPGGPCRAESVRAALAHIRPQIEWVAVHDAARPLIEQELIDQVFAAAKEYGAAVPALPVALTVKQAIGPLPAKVVRTLPRHELWAMQTPQVMRCADLLAAYAKCPLPLAQVTDDVQLLELAGLPVWLIAGDERNLKITTPLDIHLAESLWQRMHANARE